jgi:hypothetical protein
MGREDSSARMQREDLVPIVMAQEKASVLSAEVQKKQLMVNRIMQRCIGRGPRTARRSKMQEWEDQ